MRLKDLKSRKMKHVRLGENNSDRCWIVKIAIVGIFFLLVVRMGYLQIYMGEEYKYKAENNRVKFVRVDALRGNIVDANGEIVATNKIGYRLNYLNERKYNDKILKDLSSLTGRSEEYIEKRIKYGEISMYTRENTIMEDLDEETAHKILERKNEFPYLNIETYFKRKYIEDETASHVIGYVKKISNKEYEILKDEGYDDRDVIGKEGIEKEYDKVLRGEKGFEYFEVNARSIVQKVIKNKPSVKGKDVHLTIDMRLQRYMENVFKERKLVGSMIALNPKDGKVLTMVSYPTYPLNTFSSTIPSDLWNEILYDKRKPLTNKSISGEYPPGSVFKPFVAFSFLEAGLDPYEKFYDDGAYRIGEWQWRSWKRTGHGYVDLRKAIIESANVYFYRAAHQYGSGVITKNVKNFGFGRPTGIDIPGEKSGLVPSPEWKKKRFKEGWYTGDTIIFAIGQGYMTATPLQVAQAYSVLANQGYAYRPRLVDYITDGQTKEETEKIKNVDVKYPKEYYRLLKNAMIGVVEEKNGTGKILRTEGLKIAAKSGSAQNSQFKETHAWVAGYFPADNPEIVFVVLLQGAGSGGAVAGGVAKAFIDEYLSLYGEK
ncbi:penicillin-binding protein 2 [Fusobacterium perfoetens]|uniref:penicillin-binding protein 2 n=1 Tax=Fusobacterium perfoetens TaxID=852 RepID=UPI0015A1832C|nr:penicillin-binding protein 2 [Fusobacterium perfoetens]MCF2625749.1 penicillin-binding protein 2 [Fusobacterium perfoetens]